MHPAQQWLVWLLLQAMLALTLSAGPRAISGPLHLHTGADAGHQHGAAPGAVARHHHAERADVLVLEPGATGIDELGSAGANAAAVLWPGGHHGAALLPPPADVRRLVMHRTAAWTDADPWPVEHRPRG